jgi:hypothetical protein
MATQERLQLSEVEQRVCDIASEQLDRPGRSVPQFGSPGRHPAARGRCLGFRYVSLTP